MSLTIDLYGCPTDGAKFYGFHMNGTQHAAFCNAYAALSWRRGLREPDYFYVTDGDGVRVKFAENAHGHAYAIMEAT
jgi:hypothetical protein